MCQSLSLSNVRLQSYVYTDNIVGAISGGILNDRKKQTSEESRAGMLEIDQRRVSGVILSTVWRMDTGLTKAQLDKERKKEVFTWPSNYQWGWMQNSKLKKKHFNTANSWAILNLELKIKGSTIKWVDAWNVDILWYKKKKHYDFMCNPMSEKVYMNGPRIVASKSVSLIIFNGRFIRTTSESLNNIRWLDYVKIIIFKSDLRNSAISFGWEWYINKLSQVNDD